MQQTKHDLVCSTRSVLGIALRVSDALALCGLAVTSILFWTLIATALFRFDLSLSAPAAYAGVTFTGTLVFGWISGAIRDHEAERLHDSRPSTGPVTPVTATDISAHSHDE